ncbi:hypothetical protein D9M71_559510 [compost metagenome]
MHDDRETVTVLHYSAIPVRQLLRQIGPPLGQVSLEWQARLIRWVAWQLGTDCQVVEPGLRIPPRCTHPVRHLIGEEDCVSAYGCRLIGLQRGELHGREPQNTYREKHQRNQDLYQGGPTLKFELHWHPPFCWEIDPDSSIEIVRLKAAQSRLESFTARSRFTLAALNRRP